MADLKISQLNSIVTVVPATDVLPVVQGGTTLKITPNQILGAGGTATLASATITGDLTVDTSTLKVTASTDTVTVGATTTDSKFRVIDANYNGLRIGFLPGTSNYNLYDATVHEFRTANVTPQQLYTFQASSAVWFDGAGGTRMTLNSTGLGIGGSPTTGLLTVGATTNVSATANALTILSQRANLSITANGATDAVGTTINYSWANGGQGPLIFRNAAIANVMTLDASGNCGIGGTPTVRLDVQNASGDVQTRIKSATANSTLSFDYVNNYGSIVIRKSGTDVWLSGVIGDAAATPNYKIQNGSAVGVQLVSGATAWTTLSDETVKDIIEPISNAVAKVGSIRSVIGKFKTDDASKRRSFLIAQDVQSVLPEAVDVIGENNELGLRYTEVIPLLVAAIKELTARVQTLEAR